MDASKIKGKIGQQLLAAGLITEEQLQAALEQQKQTRGFLGDALVKMGIVKAELIGQMLSASMNVSYVYLANVRLDPDIVDLVSEEFQRLHSLIPYKREGNNLHVAMQDPVNVLVVDDLSLMTGYRIVPELALNEDVHAAFGRYYTLKQMATTVLKEIENTDIKAVEPELTFDQLANMADEAPIIRLVNSIITRAIGCEASDIHIEPMEKVVRVRYRIDGVLYEQTTYSPQHHAAVVSRIKIMSQLNISETRRPQDGRIGFSSEGLRFDLRVSTMRLMHGEKVVLRILDMSRIRVTLDKLGFFPEQITLWNTFLQRPHGVILVTGPTGSGKSTSLYASLNKINDKCRNIITIEDPVEYNLPGINQAQVNPKIDVTFASGLRSIVRQDPDVIMVGEIRDAVTAEMAIQAALTGHLVLSTLHTNDAPSALVRLENMGVERYLISSAVIGVMAQRLLRKICSGCAQPEQPDAHLLRALNISKEQQAHGRFQQGKGCGRCEGRGYKARTAVYEIMPMSDRLRSLLRQATDGDALKEAAIMEGMIPLREAGIRLAMSGETTLDEVYRVLLEEDQGMQTQTLSLAA